MAGKTVAALVTLLGQKLGPFYNGTAGSSGNSTTTVKDTTVLARYPNDRLVGLWYLQTSGTDNGQYRMITANSQSASTITIDAKPTSEQSMTYEIHAAEPEWLAQALRDAAKVLYIDGLLSATRHVIAAVGNSPLYDPAFVSWPTTSTLEHWAVITSTLAQSTAYSRLGGPMARLTGGAGYLESNVTNPDYLNDLEDTTFTVKGIVRTATASSAAVAWFDGASVTKSSYHTGGTQWAVLSKEITNFTTQNLVPSVRFYKDSAAGGVDATAVWIDSGLDIRSYVLPTVGRVTAVRTSTDSIEEMYTHPGPSLLVPRVDWHIIPGSQYGSFALPTILTFDDPLPGEHAVWVTASAPITVTTTRADTVEVEEEDTEVLLAQAVLELVARYERTGMAPPGHFVSARSAAAQTLTRIRQRGQDAQSGTMLPLPWGF